MRRLGWTLELENTATGGWCAVFERFGPESATLRDCSFARSPAEAIAKAALSAVEEGEVSRPGPGAARANGG
jgi:hypothetical protein